jgi:hypothetical protein
VRADIVNYLIANGFSDDKMPFYWYGHYYSSIGLYRAGGPTWETYYPRICQRILSDWQEAPHYSNVLDTAWAALILGVPYRYLPIYQR